MEEALTQRFLGRLAHDLRGPLAPLQTATYLLRTGELDDAKREELHQLLDRQARRLGGMIDELDDWLRASQGRLLGTTTRVEPVALLEVAMTAAGATGGAPPDIDDASLLATVSGDQRRLVQMMRALVEHASALAAGTAPKIRVRSDAARISIDVVASGGKVRDAGMLLEQPLDDPGEESLGLRLLVAREIARAHGGTLEAGEEDGTLRLSCTLPLRVAAG